MGSRRQFLVGTVGIGFGLLAPAHATLAAKVIVPDKLCTLSRSLIRTLSDGNAISVKREWQIGFSAVSGGFVVSGRQIAVSVDAPPSLAGLAQMEAKRTETNLFPIELDASGLLRAGVDPLTPASMDNALAKAEDFLAGQAPSDDLKAAARTFAASLDQRAAGLLSLLPRDLFFPRDKDWREAKTLALPGQQAGEMTIDFAATTDPDSGLLVRADRTISTRIGSSSRRSSEVWSLTV
ncbi:hypothetical protein [Parerythrobacter jejuensis]|uniref:Uncharacterized protein n=1 Tax=Parerythrobacter jejuensis TaxID=795812 RepID=A0A845AYZ5_9SPHN|nr:hypothetical protein [Parerythrobacter jejuensis]MXP30976.1 hypothetical protein [Parerythrobacter jejuensis]MXP33736.1 hypothetical protein [Parerythrobacter jejuensis]